LLCTVTVLGFRPRPFRTSIASAAARAVRLGSSIGTGGLFDDGGGLGAPEDDGGLGGPEDTVRTTSEPRGRSVVGFGSDAMTWSTGWSLTTRLTRTVNFSASSFDWASLTGVLAVLEFRVSRRVRLDRQSGCDVVVPCLDHVGYVVRVRQQLDGGRFIDQTDHRHPGQARRGPHRVQGDGDGGDR
jgi:hypothetical protein